MLSIGNDIIDLQLAKVQSNWQRKGFLEKQFTITEQQEILKAKNPFLQVWLFWAIKEAAYKCYTQEYKKRFFAPKKFACKNITASEAIVQIEAKKYYVTTILSKHYIYAVASNIKGKKVISDVVLADKKVLLSKKIDSKLLALFSNNTEIQKTVLGVPFLYKNNKKLPVAISKTHHGKYGAFAISYAS